MRRIFTTQQALADGETTSSLKWGVASGRFVNPLYGVYLEGGQPPTQFEQALALVVATGGAASGTLAGLLHELDSVQLVGRFVVVDRSNRTRHPVIRRHVSPVIVKGFRCTDGLDTLLDLAPTLDDCKWEQALESALRKRLLGIADLEEALAVRRRGNSRVRRVRDLRPSGAPPTESLLETLMVQLIRTDPVLSTPVRQFEVTNSFGQFVGRPDLCWPEAGVFVELDGQQHKDQPVYDARRETAIVAATGWLPARFSWHEVTKVPKSTLRRLVQIHSQARLLRSA